MGSSHSKPDKTSILSTPSSDSSVCQPPKMKPKKCLGLPFLKLEEKVDDILDKRMSWEYFSGKDSSIAHKESTDLKKPGPSTQSRTKSSNCLSFLNCMKRQKQSDEDTVEDCKYQFDLAMKNRLDKHLAMEEHFINIENSLLETLKELEKKELDEIAFEDCKNQSIMSDLEDCMNSFHKAIIYFGLEKKWCVGDHCRAIHHVDGLRHEAKITSIDDTKCTVSFWGYNEDAEVELNSLTKSLGEDFVKEQLLKARIGFIPKNVQNRRQTSGKLFTLSRADSNPDLGSTFPSFSSDPQSLIYTDDQKLLIGDLPTFFNEDQAHVGAQMQGYQFKKMTAEDANCYLDQIKYEFENQPQTYNDFLDIMKEFKSQRIDVHEVVHSVSKLFRGHPGLIVGFNKILPLGYRIEVQPNEQVSIPGTDLGGRAGSTGPTSLTILPTGPPSTSPLHTTHSQSNHSSHTTSPHSSPGNAVNKSNHTLPVANNQSHSNSQNQHAYNQSSPAHTQSSGGSPGVYSPSSTPQASQPVEYNHAINYVNKVKNRFQGQPDIYKQFLEILHTYQKEQRNLKYGVHSGSNPLTEADVYAQVAKLFQNQEDLLQEFRQFIPDENDAANALVGLQSDKVN